MRRRLRWEPCAVVWLIEDRDENVLTNEESVWARQREHFGELINEENE